ncbi:MAG TPA: FtsX-like permease family protein [Armatimonadota bacterium]
MAEEFTGQQRILQLPLRKAVSISFESIRVRFWRSVITAAGIFFGIAFLSSVLLSGSVPEAIAFKGFDRAEVQAALSRNTWLALMSLVVCTVGIANSMLMSVTERFKEIGTMKCLGALDSFVMRLFMIEAAFLGSIASTVGWLVGTLLMCLMLWSRYGGSVVAQTLASSGLRNFVTCVVAGTFLTLIATVFPARRASMLPPAAALRSEI